ncbi:E3 ubiquitin-protein ligase HERC [Acrasis kona]|uniref:E3 ubiquitin-protein ligase HERC n=1 Tax=Acrasis kona TaxID=1008807 RepID=A0AAW2YME1_9EUKA
MFNHARKNVYGFSRAYSQSTQAPGRYLMSWGNNKDGRLGLNSKVSKVDSPTLISAFTPLASKNRIDKVSCGKTHVLCSTENGTGGVTPTYGPELVKFPDNHKIVEVSAGDCISAAVTQQGDLFTWGYGGRSFLGFQIWNPALGHPNGGDLTTPKKVEYFSKNEVKIVKVSCAKYHMGAVSKDGKAYTWGKGAWGMLGNNANSNSLEPKYINSEFFKDAKVLKISLADQFGGVLTEDGKVYVFGKNSGNQLGVESNGFLYTGGQFDGVKKPALMETFTSKQIKIKDFALGSSMSAAVSDQGDLYMWGKSQQTPILVDHYEQNGKKFALQNVTSCSASDNTITCLFEDNRAFVAIDSLATRRSYGFGPRHFNGKPHKLFAGSGYTIAIVDV